MNRKNQSEIKTTPANHISSPGYLIILILIILTVVNIYLAYTLIDKIIYIAEDHNKIVNVKQVSSTVQLEVLNGCGISGIADQFTQFLRSKKFDVVNVGNYISFDIDYSLVIDRTGNLENAKNIAAVLGIDRTKIAQQINKDYFLDVTVIIGKDYNQLSLNR